MQPPRVRHLLVVMAASIVLGACNGGTSPTVPSRAPVVPVPPTSASPTPSVDPSMQPRMDGTYAVVKRVMGKRNFAGVRIGQVLHRVYRVTPVCPIGPCNAVIRIAVAETGQTITRRLAYDTSTATYSLVPAVAPVFCAGVNGKRYRLATIDTVVITPVATKPTPVDLLVTRWTAKESVRAVPRGEARRTGRCRISEATYRYLGTLQ